MQTLRIESVFEPFSDPRPGRLAARIAALTSTVGLLTGPLRTLDLKSWERVVAGLREAGLLSASPFIGKPRPKPLSPEAFANELGQLYETIEDSPIPAKEWKPMRGVFGDELLGRLLGISRPSLQRYASGDRATPQGVAERLHVLALIVSDLAGTYNEFGIRRWFERPRAQVGGRSPAAMLKHGWRPDEEGARRVRALAASLIGGAGAT